MLQPCVYGIVSDPHCRRTGRAVTSCATGSGRTVISIQETFWDFSNRVYRLPLARDTLLTLQDEHGLDVNLLLFCCWHARTRGRLDPTTIRRALVVSRPWAEQVVRPLRSARRWMKTDALGHDTAEEEDSDMGPRQRQLRDRIKALELQAERLQQAMLESLSEGPAASLPPRLESQVTDAAHNLQSLLEASAVPLSDRINELLATLVTATLILPDQEGMR